jgi:hypothetical protein
LYQIGDDVSNPALLADSCLKAIARGDGRSQQAGEDCGIMGLKKRA